MTPPLPDPDWPLFAADETDEQLAALRGLVVAIVLGVLVWLGAFAVGVWCLS